MYAIGDVAGQHDSLIKLVDKLPKKDKPIILLGDLNDRGWQSKQVIQWAIDNDVDNGGLVTTLDSNHGDMFVDWYKRLTIELGYIPRYKTGVFEYNGGRTTVSSYGHDLSLAFSRKDLLNDKIMKRHIEWLDSRPSFAKFSCGNDKYFLSHAPLNVNKHYDLLDFLDKEDLDNNFLWNRVEPYCFHKELPNTISVFGHNMQYNIKLICRQYPNGIYAKSQDMLKELVDINKNQIYGIGIDTSKVNKITAIDLESFDYFQESYL